jgi:hypothetical protein
MSVLFAVTAPIQTFGPGAKKESTTKKSKDSSGAVLCVAKIMASKSAIPEQVG